MNRWNARELATFTSDLSHGAARLYLALDEYARDSGECWPSQKTLAKRMGCTVRSVQSYLAELCEAKMVSAKRQTAGGANRYFLMHYHAKPASPPREESFVTLTKPASPLIRKNQGIEAEDSVPGETQHQNQPEEFLVPAPDPNLCMWCHGSKFRGTGSSRSACGGCGGTGRVRRFG